MRSHGSKGNNKPMLEETHPLALKFFVRVLPIVSHTVMLTTTFVYMHGEHHYAVP